MSIILLNFDFRAKVSQSYKTDIVTVHVFPIQILIFIVILDHGQYQIYSLNNHDAF